jgi:TonB family protein
MAAKSSPSQGIEPQRSFPSGKKKPKCVRNCGLDEYLGAEGSARFDFQVDASGKVTNVRINKSSGNAEVDRKAEEAVRNRKYEASDSGFSAKIRVTSEQEGSNFQRQQSERRREDTAIQAEQSRRAAEREQIDQERAQRQVEQAPPPATKPTPVEAAPPLPPKPAYETSPEPTPAYEPQAPAYEPATVYEPPAPAYEPPPEPAPVYEPQAPAYEPAPAYKPPAPAYEPPPPVPAEAPPPSGT